MNKNTEYENSITIEEYTRELEEAEAEYQRGEHISHEEMKRRAMKWDDKRKEKTETQSPATN